MKPRTPKSIELYNTLLKRGYPQEFVESEHGLDGAADDGIFITL